jgi:hypothetical protein
MAINDALLLINEKEIKLSTTLAALVSSKMGNSDKASERTKFR